MPFFRVVAQSVYSPAFYGSITTRSMWRGIGYFFLLSVVAAWVHLLPHWQTFVLLSPQNVRAAILHVGDYYPDGLRLDVLNGAVRTNVREPYVIRLSETDRKALSMAEPNLLVIDTHTSFSAQQFRAYQTLAWLGHDALFIGGDQNGQIRTADLSRTPDSHLTKQDVSAGLAALTPWASFVDPLVLIVLLVVFWLETAVRFFYLLPLTLVIWPVARAFGMPWTFGRGYLAGLYAMTLPVIGGTLLKVTGSWLGIHGFPWMFTFLTLLVLWLNVFAASRVKDQEPTPPPGGTWDSDVAYAPPT